MKIISPSVELVGEINPIEVLKRIELCGRVSHRSKAREDSAEQFIRMVIKRGHERVLEHVSLTFHIICDRAIQNELVRHRFASPTVESTRYVKYDDLEVIKPERIKVGSPMYEDWEAAVIYAEETYKALIEVGMPPEEARSVLPLCTKSELYVTANLREWRHFLKLRCDKAAHPQMRQIANKILAVFKDKLPMIVEDLI